MMRTTSITYLISVQYSDEIIWRLSRLPRLFQKCFSHILVRLVTMQTHTTVQSTASLECYITNHMSSYTVIQLMQYIIIAHTIDMQPQRILNLTTFDLTDFPDEPDIDAGQYNNLEIYYMVMKITLTKKSFIQSKNLVQAFFHLHWVHHISLFSMPQTLRHLRTSPRDFLWLLAGLGGDDSM